MTLDDGTRIAPQSAAEALERVLDASTSAEREELIADLYESPWLIKLLDEPALFQRLRPKSERELLRRAVQKARRDRLKAKISRPADRPAIVLGPHIADMQDESIEALAAQPSVYTRGRGLSHILLDEEGKPSIHEMTVHNIAAAMDRAALYVKRLGDEEPITEDCVQVDGRWCEKKEVPMRIAYQVRDAGRYPEVRKLSGVTQSPVLRKDGSLVLEAGHDKSTGLVYIPNGPIPKVPTNPTRDHAVAALKRLKNVTSEFMFARPEDGAAARSLTLTLAGRSAIDGCAPCFVADANQSGVGKTFLLQIMGLIGSGHWVGAMDWPTGRGDTDTDKAELRKRIDGEVWGGTPFAVWDNVRAAVSGTALEAVVTSTMWKLRILGATGNPEVRQRTVFAVSSNGMIIAGDMFRRVLPIRQFNPDPDPGSRIFERPDLRGLVIKHRARLHASALTILSAYLQAGAPDQGLPPWASFTEWSNLVRGALVWAGDVDPFGARQGLELVDEGRDSHDRFIAFIVGAVERREWCTRDVADAFERGHASDHFDIGGGWTAQDARDLAAELDIWDAKAKAVNRRSLGRLISRSVKNPASNGDRIERVMVGNKQKQTSNSKPLFHIVQ